VAGGQVISGMLKTVNVEVGGLMLQVEVCVIDEIMPETHVLLGMDVVKRLGGVIITADGQVKWLRRENMTMSVQTEESTNVISPGNRISDVDFDAIFDRGEWKVRWKWKNGVEPSKEEEKRQYKIRNELRKDFDAEIEDWIEEGILVKHSPTAHGEIKSYIPLIAIEQQKGDTKKIRPVFDFRELNKKLESHPGGSLPLCRDRMREWRQKGIPSHLLDLKRAYLQIKVDSELWCWQGVIWRGKTFLLTRLGFGLASAPKIMTKIVENCLSQLPGVECSSYIDDIHVAGDRKEAQRVQHHLAQFGLLSKPVEEIGGSHAVRVLGLKVDSNLAWSRESKIPKVGNGTVTKREMHRIVGELLGHFPKVGWLRVACGFLQRKASESKIDWDEKVDAGLMRCLDDLFEKLEKEGDPAKGQWSVACTPKIVLWTDASQIAMGVALEVNDDIIEDAAWLRKKEDCSHINMSELDAVIKGINLATRWNPSCIELMVDSATVAGWLRSVFDHTHNVHSKSMGELLIRRRLQVLEEMVKFMEAPITVTLVPSHKNKADELTRVPRNWLKKEMTSACAHVMDPDCLKNYIREIHEKAHFGTARTLELVRSKFGDEAKPTLVKEVISECARCAKIDPHIRNSGYSGKLSVGRVWQRLATDVTHIEHVPYLTIVDANSRYAVWQRLPTESGGSIAQGLHKVFAWFGPPEELLSDNGTAFRSDEVKKVLEKWTVKQRFSSAYRPQGNGLAERVHRTVKRTLARTSCTVEEAVFWINATKANESKLSPFEILFRARPRRPGIDSAREWIKKPVEESQKTNRDEECRNPLQVGDSVYLRPGDGKCDKEWTGPHVVSKVMSPVTVELDHDGVTRHTNHCRKTENRNDSSTDEEELFGEINHGQPDLPSTSEAETQYASRPKRTRMSPDRYGVIKW